MEGLSVKYIKFLITLECLFIVYVDLEIYLKLISDV